MDYAECPSRFEAMLEALGPGEPARDFGLDPIHAVHDSAYVAFLREAHAQWRAAGRDGDAMGYVFPVVRRRPLDLERIDAKIGAFSMDASTPIAADTWAAAYGGAQSALTALDAVLTGVSGSRKLRSVLSRLESRQQALVFGHAVPMPVVIRTRDYGTPESYRDLGWRDAVEMKAQMERDAEDLFGAPEGP